MCAKEAPAKNLINTAIEASLKFEEYMDSIDFNSYLLPAEEKSEVKCTKRYKNYLSKIGEAKSTLHLMLKKANANEIIKCLFEAKNARLEARKQTERDNEKHYYFAAISKLNNALIKIQLENFKEESEGGFFSKNNWAKVLLYNELSICHSGLAEPSISLGYAERSIALLRKIFTTKDSAIKKADDKIKLLYTFGLYNKGEAERLLHDYDQSLKTFGEILEIYEDNSLWSDGRLSDYYSALIRVGMILIDWGRGEEALENLGKTEKLATDDNRVQEVRLEKIRAHIDMKDYEHKDVLPVLEKYKDEQFDFTFSKRKAAVIELRLVTEFIRNQYERFYEQNDAISKTIKAKYVDFTKTAKTLLNECVDRRDSDSFKKVCLRLSDYFHELKKNSEDNDQRRKNWINELRYYYLYLCYVIIFEEPEILEKAGKKREEIVHDWINENEVDKRDLELLINNYETKLNFNFSRCIRKIDDEKYLTGFFRTYIASDMQKVSFNPKNKKEIISELKDTLVNLFDEKENFTEAQKIQEDFITYSTNIEQTKKPSKRKDSVTFINDYFLKDSDIKTNDDRVCLNPTSILKKMMENTKNFADNVVGKTARFSVSEEFKGVFTVLRRWNSFTPALTSSINPSKGGGYFLYFSCNNMTHGIVIDPGYDFLENLLSTGFRIGDINAVVISHAHPDHTDSLPSILSLFHEANGRLGRYHRGEGERFNKKHLKLVLSQGVFDQYYSGFIKPSQESLKDVVVVKKKSEKPCYSFKFNDDEHYSIELNAFPTSHEDLMKKWESLGFIITIKTNGEPKRRIGYTSDAHWTEEFSDNLKNCDIVCAHLGSIIDILGEKDFSILCECCDKESPNKDCKHYSSCQESNFKNRETSITKMLKQAHEQKHLYLSGLTMLFDDLLEKGKMDLAIISEFGEELKGGIRMDLYKKFNDWFQIKRAKIKGKDATCIPGDIGLEIDVMKSDILCSCCQTFKNKQKITPVAYGKEEAIFYVCDECTSVLSSYQIGQKLDQYYENGRKLESANESKK